MKNVLRFLFLGFLTLTVVLVVPNLERDIPVEELKARYANDASQFVTIGDVSVHYRVEGEGPPLLLLHGTAASLHTWDGWTEQLKEEHQIIRLDLPAFGLTGHDPSAEYSIEYYVDFLRKFMAYLRLPKVILAGNSLGGQIAWHFAASHPDKVDALVLIDPAGLGMNGSQPFVFKLARTPVLNQALLHVTPRSFIRKNLREVYHDDSKITEALVDRYHQMTLREGNREAFIARARRMRSQADETLLTTIKAPTLILWGAQDQWIPARLGEAFQSLIPNAELHIIPQSGHVPMEENPVLSTNLYKRFIQKANGWTALWNGQDLEGWQTYLHTPFQSKEDSMGHPALPFGVDNDPLDVMKVVSLGDGNAIRISGVAWGTMHTLEDFGNYHLKLKMKWGNEMHVPRANGPRDSGLLYHGFGAPGVVDKCWITSQELQIQEGDMGDYWPVGRVSMEVPSRPYENGYHMYDPQAPRRTYYFAPYDPDNRDISLAKRRVLKGSDAEAPLGQWNDMELITLGDSSIHIVNGVVVMRLYQSKVAATGQSLTRGKIALQSEGAEVFFRDIYLQPIETVPLQYRP